MRRGRIGSCLLVLAACVAAFAGSVLRSDAAPPAHRALVERVEWEMSDAGASVIVVVKGRVDYQSRFAPADPTTNLPPRAYVDLHPAQLGDQISREPLIVDDRLVRRIRLGQFDKDTVRVVLDLSRPARLRVEIRDRPSRLMLRLARNQTDEALAEAAPPSVPQRPEDIARRDAEMRRERIALQRETARREEAERKEAARREAAEQKEREAVARREEAERKAEAARLKREEIARQREAARREREEIARQEEAARQEREEIARQEEAAREERKEIARQEEAAREEREEIARQQEAARKEREEIARQEEAARKEREEIARQEEAARREREEAARLEALARSDEDDGDEDDEELAAPRGRLDVRRGDEIEPYDAPALAESAGGVREDESPASRSRFDVARNDASEPGGEPAWREEPAGSEEAEDRPRPTPGDAARSPPLFLSQHAELPRWTARPEAAPPIEIEPPPPAKERAAAKARPRTPPGSTAEPKTVVLDPGHGGKDPGAEGSFGVPEKHVTLALAYLIKEKLEEQGGVRVVLTRTDDRYVSLEERTATANAQGAELFVSIHANASESDGLSGIETYTLNNTDDRATIRLAALENGLTLAGATPGEQDLAYILSDLVQTGKEDESVLLARAVQGELVRYLRGRWKNVSDLGVKKGPFYVLVGAYMPCVLVEVGFLTHPVEGPRMATHRYQRDIAEGVAEGVRRFLAAPPPGANL
jgi:N-acetylmuramoyl-L-alanine amidase